MASSCLLGMQELKAASQHPDPLSRGSAAKPDPPHANYSQVACRRCGSSLLFTNEQHAAATAAAAAAADLD